MESVIASPWPVWSVVGAALLGVIVRPFSWPEYIWVLAGAALLVVLGLLGPGDAARGVERGADVYLFLIGMMLLAELAGQEGLFDWLAARAGRVANGSAARLFALVFAVGTLVTVFLSNDATAVVLTPAVAAVARTAKARDPLPYLFACAFIANAASFTLPISNPANLVIYGSHMPALLPWLRQFALPSLLAVLVTFAAARTAMASRLREPLSSEIDVPALSRAGRLAAYGIGAAAFVLLAASAFGIALGLPTCVVGVMAALLVFRCSRHAPIDTFRRLAWGVLPLVAGLFVLVEALDRTGVTSGLAHALGALTATSPRLAAWTSGVVLAAGSNLVNNLPAGLMAGHVAQAANVSDGVRAAILIGIDLGPNLSVTGSLATILWLSALRREGHEVGAMTFLKVGVLVMPVALLVALAGAWAAG